MSLNPRDLSEYSHLTDGAAYLHPIFHSQTENSIELLSHKGDLILSRSSSILQIKPASIQQKGYDLEGCNRTFSAT